MATRRSINQAKYDSTHCRFFGLKLNNENDADIIKAIESAPSKQGFVKQAIRFYLDNTHPVPKKKRTILKYRYIIGYYQVKESDFMSYGFTDKQIEDMKNGKSLVKDGKVFTIHVK